jgi:DNA polymerase-1
MTSREERIALLDADIFAFRATVVVEEPIEWEHDLWTLHADFGQAKAIFEDMVFEIREDLLVDRVVMVLSDRMNWRKSIMPEYKAHRKKDRKPVCFNAMKEYIHANYETWQRPDLEGDDVLGILSTHPKLIPGRKIIVSLDKDMQTIPGFALNDGHARKGMLDNPHTDYASYTRKISEAQADEYHMYQTLVGDTSDGYKGCPGVGPTKAQRIIADACNEAGTFSLPVVWHAVLAAYKKAGLGPEVALLNARVARICRHTDYDFQKKEVIHWNPPREK